MEDSLRELIRRARRSGMSTDQPDRASKPNPLEQRAAEAVRLARVATAMHMNHAMIVNQSPISDSCGDGERRAHENIPADAPSRTLLHGQGARS